MGMKLITPPAVTPVALADVKLQSRITGTDEDVLLTQMIASATAGCENKLKRAICTQTWERTEDRFPADGSAIILPFPPVQTITSILYFDDNNVQQTLSPGSYVLDNDSEPGWTMPAWGYVWPTTAFVPNAVRIRYVCGYGVASAVPEAIKTWILMRVASLYEAREQFITGTIVQQNPVADAILDRYVLRYVP
jgi:uncharacterized phiE125 gp8 family phage protein